WTCKICNKTFAQNSNFKNHIRTHSDERPFVCEICCIGFKERYHLKKHMLFKHSNELKEECRVCGKKFKDSTAVRAHERIHSDVRPYACRRCGKTFKTSECLWHHENRSKTCKKRFLCIKCSKQFASYTAFDKHMVTHSELRPYKCQVCDIGFKLKVHLKKHNLYRHSSEYPCECSICGKKFKDSSAVRLHERIHSNDRPFKCVCGKSFKTRENLWGH
ncbi:hypothetical protein CAPTEDRAFT_34004, partial [Capitella teleta]